MSKNKFLVLSSCALIAILCSSCNNIVHSSEVDYGEEVTYPTTKEGEVVPIPCKGPNPILEEITDLKLSFESGLVSEAISGSLNVESFEVIDGDATDGTKSLKATIKQSDYGIKISKEYLDLCFADPNVVAINFDAKGSVVSSNFRHRTAAKNVCYENNNTNYGLDTNWKRFSFTREFYNSHVDSTDYVIFGGGLNQGDYVLIDNIEPVKKELTSYGFDNGRFSYGLTAANYFTFGPTTSDNLFRHNCGEGIISDVNFDYNIKSEGLRSLHFAKNSGYCAFFLNSNLVSTLKSNDEISIDIYSTVGARCDKDVGNIIDGLNNRTIPTKIANTWQTYTFKKSQITGDGRFLIIQGSTAGDWYFDNIKVARYNDTVTSYQNLGPQILLDTASNVKITLNHDAEVIDSILIDNNAIDLGTVSYFMNEVNIKSSNFTKGNHEIVINYRNGEDVYKDYFYNEIVLGTTNSTLSTVLTYMSDGYYTLSGYSNVYRIKCNGKEVAYETNGNDYLIPEATLIELLPESNGSKVNGTINLEIYNLTKESVGTIGEEQIFQNYNNVIIQPIAITLNGSSQVKSIPTYEGKGLDTHAYSSTSSHATRQNYEEYFGVDKLSKFANTGLDIIYEQAVHVSVDDTALCDGLVYLLNNAKTVGKKVLLTDDALATLSRQTIDLVGNDIVLGTNVTKHFNSEDELDAYVESRLRIYIDNPNVYGVSVGDEQTYNMITHGFGQVFRSIHRVLNKLNRNDFFVNSNLNPMTATSDVLIGYKADKEEPEKNYKIYVEKYLEETGNNYIQYDAYPLVDAYATIGGALYNDDGSLKSLGYGVSNFTYRQLLESATLAKEHNVDLYVVNQSFMNGSNRYLNPSDIAWINNTVVGLGVKHLSYFVYQNRHSTGTERWLDGAAFLGQNGNTNSCYYYYQSQLAQINNFKKTISAFDFDWWQLINGGTYSDAWAYNSTNSSVFKEVIPTPSKTYGALKEYSVDNQWGLLTGLKDASNNKMYMVQNVHNDFDTEMLQTYTITFDSNNYKYAVIWENGSPRISKLGTVTEYLIKKYNTLTLKLSSGHAAYFMLF